MVDFSKLLSKPMGEAKAPKALPVGDYQGIIRSHEIVEAPKDRDYDMIVRFHGTYSAWPDDTDEQDRVEDRGSEGPQPIDLSKRRWRRDFYSHRLDQLDTFMKSVGIAADGRSYQELLGETHGVTVVVEVQQYINKNTGELGNQVNNIRGLEG